MKAERHAKAHKLMKRCGYAGGGDVSFDNLVKGKTALKEAQDYTKSSGAKLGTDYPGSRLDWQRSEIARDRAARAFGQDEFARHPIDQPEGYPTPRARGGRT